MTKVEQLKAKMYAIEILEERLKLNEETEESIMNRNKEDDIMDWEVEAIEEARNRIQQLEYIIEELAK